MDFVSRGDMKQMVRAVRGGSSWEEVRTMFPQVAPELLDEHLREWVLETAGVSPTPVVASSPDPDKPKRRKA